MTGLTDDKRTMGHTAQKEPEKWGRIKQKAMELGISAEELILRADPGAGSKEEPAQSQKELDDIKDALRALASQVSELTQNQQNQAVQAQQQPDQFSQIESFAKAMGALKAYDNAIIGQYQSLQDQIIENMPLGDDSSVAGDDTPEDMFMKVLAQKMAGQVGGGGSQQAPSSETTPNTVPVVNPTNEVKPMDLNADELIKQVPEGTKQKIRDGDLSLEDAKQQASALMAANGIHQWDESIVDEMYQKIKNDGGVPDATSEDSNVSGPEVHQN